jgi:t-SNARE complex subunit (syntaxin)
VRAVSNKIRNVNKKLSDIADLEAKPADQLKPEQKEKISKKQQLLDENQKFEEILRFYKQIENERKESEVSEAHKLLHLSALVSLLTNQPESLFERKILTKEEAKLF